jgi:hypothetical protein
VADWLITYGSWCLAPFGLLGMWVVGLKKRWGWVLGMSTQSLWAFYAVGTGQYGFLIGTCSYFAVYLRNWLRWRHLAVQPVALERTVLLIDLLRELNRLELEKDRDGNAEQPWWYMRDSLAEALGIAFDDELPDEDEEVPA